MSGCLGCQKCEAGPVVTLADGRIVCNACEDWRQETEARWVLNLPGKEARQQFLEGVAKRRGQAHADELKRVIRLLWDKSRAA
ncbi:MAG: hypothetical protein RJA36_924 [Pseudomonadota bacterium]|jgi:hypothetical protein